GVLHFLEALGLHLPRLARGQGRNVLGREPGVVEDVGAAAGLAHQRGRSPSGEGRRAVVADDARRLDPVVEDLDGDEIGPDLRRVVRCGRTARVRRLSRGAYGWVLAAGALRLSGDPDGGGVAV